MKQDKEKSYTPTEVEYKRYYNIMYKIRNELVDIKAPLEHYQQYFSKHFTSLSEVFPYTEPIMKRFGYKGEIKDGFIIWGK